MLCSWTNSRYCIRVSREQFCKGGFNNIIRCMFVEVKVYWIGDLQLLYYL